MTAAAPRNRTPYDLAFLETIEARINAEHDLLRATRELKDAADTGNLVRVAGASHRLQSVTRRDRAAASALATAITLEAESRA